MKKSANRCGARPLAIRQLSRSNVSPELKIKHMTESNTSASYLDLLLPIGRDGQLHTSLSDKCDFLNFNISNFPFLSSNITNGKSARIKLIMQRVLS